MRKNRRIDFQYFLKEVDRQWSDILYQLEQLIERIETCELSERDEIINALKDILDENE